MAAVSREAAGEGLTIWFTGSSSAGSTISESICKQLQARGHTIERLNGVNAVIVTGSPNDKVCDDVRRGGSSLEVYVHDPALLQKHDRNGIPEILGPAIECDTSRESVEESVARVMRAVENRLQAIEQSGEPGSSQLRSKLLAPAQVDEWIAAQRAAGRHVGFTCGSFDIMHAGHVDYLSKARANCDRLLVAVNSDASVRRYKNPLRPVNPETERMYVVAALAAVDVVTILDEDRPLSLLLRWKPDLYIKGGDYKSSSLRSATAVEEYGGRVLLIPSDFTASTSAMIERIAAISNHSAPDRVADSPVRGLVLLDRDGTLIRDIPYLHDPAQVELLPGVGEGLAALQAAGFRLAIVTNQQGIALGYYTTQQFIAVNQQLFRALAPFGVHIAKIYYCPHNAAEHCGCRKPESGMVKRALSELRAPAGRTFLIGDSSGDIAAGNAESCRTIHVGQAASLPADYCATNFADAVRWIIDSDGGVV